jgi:hypothetical protein
MPLNELDYAIVRRIGGFACVQTGCSAVGSINGLTMMVATRVADLNLQDAG